MLLGLRPGPSWNEGSESSGVRLRLPELLDHRLNGNTEKFRRRNLSIEKKALSFFLMSARFIHRSLSATTMAAIVLRLQRRPAW